MKRNRVRHRIEWLEQRLALSSTALVSDINKIATHSSNPRSFTSVGSLAFFVAESQSGAELWKTDGTTKGTTLVDDIRPGEAGSFPTSLVESNGLLFFHVDEDVWRSDGTAAGTFLVAADAKLEATSNTGVLLVGDGYLVSDGGLATGVELATESSVVAAADDYFVIQNESGFQRVSANGMVSPFLEGAEGAIAFQSGNALFWSSQSPSNRFVRIDLGDPTDVVEFVLDAEIEFRQESFFSSSEITLFRDNAGLRLLSDDGDHPPVVELVDEPREIQITADGSFWFLDGSRLLKTDSRAERTIELASFGPETWVHGLRASDRLATFIVDDGSPQVWGSDGTNAGTNEISDFASGMDDPRTLLVTKERIFFSGDGESGLELFASDGTPAGTVEIDINPTTVGSAPEELFQIESGEILLSASGEAGRELWLTDGTEPGTKLVLDVAKGPGTAGSSPTEFTRFRDQLYFVANDGRFGSELWRTDGSEAGTTMVADIFSGRRGSFPTELTVVDDTLYFVAEDERGRELWATDGTAGGTQLVADIVVGELGSFPHNLVVDDGRLYFLARSQYIQLDRGSGWLPTLWRVEQGVAELFYSPPVEQRWQPKMKDLTVFDDKIYFLCERCFSSPWPSEFSLIEVTRRGDARALAPRISELPAIAGLRVVGDYLVLPTHRTSLSVLDADGVVQSITSDSQRIIKLFATDRELFYTIRRPSNFFVSTDESLEATSIKDSFLTLTSIFKSEFGFILVDQKSQEITVKLARDLGALASNDLSDLAVFKTWFSSFAPRDFVEFQNEVYFVAGTPQRGTEIWKTNGTPEGTVQVTSFPANPLGSAPTSLAVIGDQLFFAADDGVHGYELWSFSSRGDANLDGVVDAQDIDMLFAAVDGGVWQPSLDLNGDDTLDQRDVDVLVQDVLRTRYGDLNLDQKVDFADFLWLANSFADDDVGWSAGRTSVDQSAGRFASFLQLSTNFGFGLPGFDAE